MRTRNCDECAHYILHTKSNDLCANRHNPRHYAPENIGQLMSGNYGHKRKCADFEKVEDDK